RILRNMRMMAHYRIRRRKVSATAAAKTFGRLVDRVREEKATYVVERGGTAVARISPIDAPTATIADLRTLVGDLPRPDDEYARAVAKAIGRRNRPRTRRNPWER